MMMLPISLTIAAGAALLNIWLAMRVSRTRRQEEVWVGDGGNERVIRRMRAHSNFIENTALVLILLVLVELVLGSSIWLWSAGALYLVGGLLPELGMDGTFLGRLAGGIITLPPCLGLAYTAPPHV